MSERLLTVADRRAFEEGWDERSGMTLEDLRRFHQVGVPGDCESEQCRGWQMVNELHLADLVDLRQAPDIIAYDEADAARLRTLVPPGRASIVRVG